MTGLRLRNACLRLIVTHSRVTLSDLRSVKLPHECPTPLAAFCALSALVGPQTTSSIRPERPAARDSAW
jgi:hypothetical protein